MRELIKLVLGAHGHGRSGLDGLKAHDHANGKKRLDLVAETLTGVMTQAGVTSLCGRDIVMNQTFWVGIYPGLAKPQLDYIVEKIASYCRSW